MRRWQLRLPETACPFVCVREGIQEVYALTHDVVHIVVSGGCRRGSSPSTNWRGMFGKVGDGRLGQARREQRDVDSRHTFDSGPGAESLAGGKTHKHENA